MVLQTVLLLLTKIIENCVCVNKIKYKYYMKKKKLNLKLENFKKIRNEIIKRKNLNKFYVEIKKFKSKKMTKNKKMIEAHKLVFTKMNKMIYYRLIIYS